jgi:hypothetical protein
MLRATLSMCVLASGVLAGCDLADALEGEPCAVPKDCWRTQECARTADEVALDLPGLCMPKGTGCIFGEQLGCGCDPYDSALNCTYSAAGVEGLEYPKMVCDTVQLVCLVEPAESEEQP